MPTVTVNRELALPVSVAEAGWYDTRSWPAWVDGCERVVSVGDGWPHVGAVVVWESTPAGRGRVTERGGGFQTRAGQALEVSDSSITGRQTVQFTPSEGGVLVGLALEYRLLRRSPLTALVDLLFIRRAMSQSLARTLERFGAGLTPGAAAP